MTFVFVYELAPRVLLFGEFVDLVRKICNPTWEFCEWLREWNDELHVDKLFCGEDGLVEVEEDPASQWGIVWIYRFSCLHLLCLEPE